MSLTHDGTGRFRLGWRLLLFLTMTFSTSWVVGWLLPWRGIWAGAAALLVGSLVAGWVALAMEGLSPGALGFHLARSVPREASIGVGLGVGLAVLVVFAITAAGGLTWSWSGGSWGAWVVGAGRLFALLALAAAAEEAFVRGYLLQTLADGWGAGWALVLTSAAFGALHMGNPDATALGAANTAAAGLFLGAVVLRTGSLWWGTGAHLGWNWGVGCLAGLPVSGFGLGGATVAVAVPVGPDWLGGGRFGPEGSALATLAFLAAAAACWWGPWPGMEAAAAERRSRKNRLNRNRTASWRRRRNREEQMP